MIKLRKKLIAIFLIFNITLVACMGFFFVNTSKVSAISFGEQIILEININAAAKSYSVEELVTQGGLENPPMNGPVLRAGAFEAYSQNEPVLQYDSNTIIVIENAKLKITGNSVGASIFKVKINWDTLGVTEYVVKANVIAKLPSDTVPSSITIGATPTESNLRLYRGIATRVDFVSQVPNVSTSGFISLKNKVANDLRIKSFGEANSGIYIDVISSNPDKIHIKKIESGLNDKNNVYFIVEVLDASLTTVKVTVNFKSLSDSVPIEMNFTMSDGSAGGASLKSVDQITQKIGGMESATIKFVDLFDGLAINDKIILNTNSKIESNELVVSIEPIQNDNGDIDSIKVTPKVTGYTSIKLQLIHSGSGGNISLSASIPIEIKGIYSFIQIEEYSGKSVSYSTSDGAFKNAGNDGYLFKSVQEISDENIATAHVENGKLIINTKNEGTTKIIVRLYNPVNGDGEDNYVTASIPITVNKNIFFNSLTTAGIITFAVLAGIVLLLILYFILSVVFKARKKKRERLEFEKQTAKKLAEKKELQDMKRQSQARAMQSSMMMNGMMMQQAPMMAGLALGSGQSMPNPNALQLNSAGSMQRQKSPMLLNTSSEQNSKNATVDESSSKAKGAADADNFMKEIAEKAKRNAEKAAAEKKAKQEAEKKAKQEAEKKAAAEKAAKAKAMQDAKIAAMQAAKAKAAQEAKAKAEQEAKAKAEQEDTVVTSKQIFSEEESLQMAPQEVQQVAVEQDEYLTDDQAFEAAMLALSKLGLSPEEKAEKEKLFMEKRTKAMEIQNDVCDIMTNNMKLKKLLYSNDFENKKLSDDIVTINQKLPTSQSEEEITMYQNMINQNQEKSKAIKAETSNIESDRLAGDAAKQNKLTEIDDVLSEKELEPYKKVLEKNRDNLQAELDKDYEKYLENYAQEANANQALEEVERMKAEMKRKAEAERLKEFNMNVDAKVAQIDGIVENARLANDLNDIENANIKLQTISQSMSEEEVSDQRVVNAFDSAANILNQRYNEIMQMQQSKAESEQKAKAAADEVMAINSKLIDGLKYQMESEKEKFKRTYDNERSMARINSIVADMQNVSDPAKIAAMQENVATLNGLIATRNSEVSDIDNQVSHEMADMENQQNKMFGLINEYALNDLQNQLDAQNTQTQNMLENDYNQFVQNYKQSVELREQQEETARMQKQMQEQALQGVINARLNEISLIAKDIAASPNLEVLKSNSDKIAMIENTLKDEEKVDSINAAIKSAKDASSSREKAIKEAIQRAELQEKEVNAVRAQVLKLKEQIPTVKTLEEAEALFNKFEKIEDGLKENLRVERVLVPISKCKEAVLRMQELIKSKMQKPKKKKMIKKTIISKKKKKSTKKKVAGKSSSGKSGVKKSSSSSKSGKSSKGKTSSSKKSSGKSTKTVKAKKK